MGSLFAAAGVFMGIHLLVSGTTLRDLIVQRIGEKLYLPLFALTSLGAVVWLCYAYESAKYSPANTVLFQSGALVWALGPVVVGLAFALVVPGVLRSNPTSACQGKAKIAGVLRVTRHPFLVGVILWSGFHLVAVGTLAGMIFFASFLLVALIGTKAIDHKVSRKRPQDWKYICGETSILPFRAIGEKRNQFVVHEYFDWRFTVAVVAFATFLYFHAALFGVPAAPPSWFS